MTTEQPWYIRALAGAIIGAFLLAAIPAALTWIQAQSKQHSSSAQVKVTSPPIESDRETAPPARSGLIIKNSISRGNGRDGMNLPADANITIINPQVEDNARDGIHIRKPGETE